MIQHIRSRGYEVMDREPTLEDRRRFPRIARVTRRPGYPAERTRLDHPLVQALTGAMRGHGPVVVLPSLGGSLPLYLIRQELGAATVTLGLWNHDNNQHAENENVRIDYLLNGIAAIAAVMTMQ